MQTAVHDFIEGKRTPIKKKTIREDLGRQKDLQ